MKPKEEEVLNRLTAELENKHFKIRTTFNVQLNKQYLTPKFYARHDAFFLEQADKTYVELLAKRNASPSEKYPFPQTMNQRYGWYPFTFEVDRSNRLFTCRRAADPDIKLEVELKKLMHKR